MSVLMACYWGTGCEIISCSFSPLQSLKRIPIHSYTHTHRPIHTFVIAVGLSRLLVWKAACVFHKREQRGSPLRTLGNHQRPAPCMLPCPSAIQHLCVSSFTAPFLICLCYILACLIYSMTWIYKPCFIGFVTWKIHSQGGLIPLHSLFLPCEFMGQFNSLLLWLNGVILCWESLNISSGML